MEKNTRTSEYRLCGNLRAVTTPAHLKIIGVFTGDFFGSSALPVSLAPCALFRELRGRHVCRHRRRRVVLFPERGTPLFAVLLSMLREHVLSGALSICTHTRRPGCISAFPLDALAKVRVHFYKPAQADTPVTLLDPYLSTLRRTLAARREKIAHNTRETRATAGDAP